MINRSDCRGKEAIVNRLLEFLAAPSESLLTSYSGDSVDDVIAASTETRKRRGRPPKNQSSQHPPQKKRGRGRPKKVREEEVEEEEELEFVDDKVEEMEEVEEEEEEQEEQDDDNDEVVDGQTIPSDRKLRIFVRAYVQCFDLDKCNARHAITTASDKFKVNLECRKTKIMQLLKDEIQ